MQGNGFQIAFETFNFTISTPVREKYEKRDAEGYDIEGVSPGYDVYKKLKRNLQKDVNSLTDGSMKSKDKDTKNPEGSSEHIYDKETSSLQVLADAAVCVSHNEITSSEASTADSSTLESSTHASISPNLSSLILPPKILSSKRKSVGATDLLSDHVTPSDLIPSMSLNQLKVPKQKAER